MITTIKKIVLGSISILVISFLVWLLFLLNPTLSYANKTQFDFITVYHNQGLDEPTGLVIRNAINLLKKSDLFDENISIDLCLNDDKIYPKLHPFAGEPIAYAFLNKTVLKNCEVYFEDNVATTEWAINNHEFRKFDLTWVLAHEFTHNLQYKANAKYVVKNTIGKINWKLEGHADYISRGFKNDGQLIDKIDKYLVEAQKEHNGLPVFELKDGTKQILPYFKYALVVQYLMEQKGLNFYQICEIETSLNDLYMEMINWRNSPKK